MDEQDDIIGGPAPGEPATPTLDPVLERLKAALAAAEPGLDPALIQGTSLEEIEASFEAARATLHRLREQARLEAAAAIPAGAPVRGPESAGSPLAKIRRGLADLGRTA